MTPGEICREYRAAKNKKQQISILADQNLTTKAEIVKILAENGEDISCTEKKKAPNSTSTIQITLPPTNIQMPEAVAAALFVGMDAIDADISHLKADRDEIDRQIREKEQEYMEIANYLKGCGERQEQSTNKAKEYREYRERMEKCKNLQLVGN